MTRRNACPSAPGPLEEYAARFDDLFTHAAQRRGFRDYLAGLLLPRDRNKTSHVAHQYLGSVGKIANGIVSVTSLWADERVHYPLHVVPYTPAARLPLGKKDPTLRTKPHLAVGLVSRAQDLGVPFRAVVADCIYGDSAAFEGTLWGARLPYVLAVRPSRGTWGPEDAAHTPEDAAREVPWTSAQEPGGWTAVERHFRDGHTETWW